MKWEFQCVFFDIFPKIQLMKKLLEVNYNPSSHKYDDWIDNKYELLDNGKSIKLCNQTTITSNISIYLKNVHVHFLWSLGYILQKMMTEGSVALFFTISVYDILLTVRKKEWYILKQDWKKFLLDFPKQWIGKLNEIKSTTNESLIRNICFKFYHNLGSR